MQANNTLLTAARAIGFGNPNRRLEQFDDFTNQFHLWVHSSKQEVAGLPNKRKPNIVSGITDAFNQLYGMYNKIGIHEGEYGYHNLCVDDRTTHNLSEADCIVISHPFSADGKCSHAKIEEADKLNIPIFIDCAFFGICTDIDFNFKKYKNVQSVCFSLSKAFGTGLTRVGLLYTKDKFPCTIYNEWQYPLIASAEYHYSNMKTIGPDDLPKQYMQSQIKICKELELEPSPTIIFGLDYTDKYNDFKRGPVNRVCITRRLELDKG